MCRGAREIGARVCDRPRMSNAPFNRSRVDATRRKEEGRKHECARTIVADKRLRSFRNGPTTRWRAGACHTKKMASWSPSGLAKPTKHGANAAGPLRQGRQKSGEVV